MAGFKMTTEVNRGVQFQVLPMCPVRSVTYVSGRSLNSLHALNEPTSGSSAFRTDALLLQRPSLLGFRFAEDAYTATKPQELNHVAETPSLPLVVKRSR